MSNDSSGPEPIEENPDEVLREYEEKYDMKTEEFLQLAQEKPEQLENRLDSVDYMDWKLLAIKSQEIEQEDAVTV